MPIKTRRRGGYSREVLGHILKHEFWKQEQVGGGIISGDGIRYDYRSSRNSGTYVFRGGRTKGKKECFMLMVDADGTGELHGLKQSADCALDPGGSGRSLVHAAVELAKQKGVKHLHLTDLSRKPLHDDKSFRLVWMYFLTTGKTWYESVIPGLRPLTKADNVEQSRACVRTISWADVIRARPQIIVPIDITDIDISQPGTAMLVLQRVKQSASPDFFADYEDNLVGVCDIGYLYGLEWVVEL